VSARCSDKHVRTATPGAVFEAGPSRSAWAGQGNTGAHDIRKRPSTADDSQPSKGPLTWAFSVLRHCPRMPHLHLLSGSGCSQFPFWRSPSERKRTTGS
jgi:hypothetical protein